MKLPVTVSMRLHKVSAWAVLVLWVLLAAGCGLIAWWIISSDNATGSDRVFDLAVVGIAMLTVSMGVAGAALALRGHRLGRILLALPGALFCIAVLLALPAAAWAGAANLVVKASFSALILFAHAVVILGSPVRSMDGAEPPA